MELRQLATFRIAAATLSFTRTAAALNYAQSSVTAQIQALEEELGVRLFDRLGKRVALTDAGRRLVDYAEKLLNLADEARTMVATHEVPMGAVTISAPETVCTYRLPAVLQKFRNQFPRARLLFRPCPVPDLRRLVLEGALDVAFVLEEPLRSSSLVIEELASEPLVVLAHPDHPLAASRRVRPEELDGELFLLTEVGCGYRNIFERALADDGVEPMASIEFGSVEAIKQCVMSGMGISVLPQVTVAREIADGRLSALPWDGPELRVMSQMLWHKDKWHSPALDAFLQLSRQILAVAD